MIDINTTMTAQIPSGFAMPTSAPTTAAQTIAMRGTGLRGAGAGMATVAVCTAPVYDARERLETGDAVRMPFPGPTAWSPPPS